VSWWEILYVAVATLLFLVLYRELSEEPFTVRVSLAALSGVGWGSFVIICALFLLIDVVAMIAKVFRK